MYCLNTNAKHLLLPSQILVAQPQMVLDMQQAGLPSAMDVEGAPGQVIWGFVSGLYTLRIRVWPIIMLAVSSLPAESICGAGTLKHPPPSSFTAQCLTVRATHSYTTTNDYSNSSWISSWSWDTSKELRRNIPNIQICKNWWYEIHNCVL